MRSQLIDNVAVEDAPLELSPDEEETKEKLWNDADAQQLLRSLARLRKSYHLVEKGDIVDDLEETELCPMTKSRLQELLRKFCDKALISKSDKSLSSHPQFRLPGVKRLDQFINPEKGDLLDVEGSKHSANPSCEDSQNPQMRHMVSNLSKLKSVGSKDSPIVNLDPGDERVVGAEVVPALAALDASAAASINERPPAQESSPETANKSNSASAEQEPGERAESNESNQETNNPDQLVCPPNIDEEVFNCLPREMQQEIVDQHQETAQISDSGFDPSALAALPEDMRWEILEQEQQQQCLREQKATQPAANLANAEEMNKTDFLGISSVTAFTVGNKRKTFMPVGSRESPIVLLDSGDESSMSSVTAPTVKKKRKTTSPQKVGTKKKRGHSTANIVSPEKVRDNGKSSPLSFVGKRIAKSDGSQLYFGRVFEYYEDGECWYIDYDDGDGEDFNEEQLREALCLYERHKVHDH